MEEKQFTWIPFYKELAKALLIYKDNRNVNNNPKVYHHNNRVVYLFITTFCCVVKPALQETDI